MLYRTIDNVIAVRLEIGEEIVSSIKELCTKENVKSAVVHGIGALKSAKIGLFDLGKHKYIENEFNQFMELTSLDGSVTKKDGETYIHFHANLGTETGQALGGHLSEAIVGATAEIFIFKLSEEIGRFYDAEVTTLNLMDI